MFEIEGKQYTLDQLKDSAEKSNLTLDQYIKVSGAKELEVGDKDKKETSTPQPEKQVTIEEYNKAVKRKQALDSKIQLTPEEASAQAKLLQSRADELFIPKSEFKKTYLYAGIGNQPAAVPEKPFDGYDYFVEKASKELDTSKATEKDILNLAKQYWIDEQVRTYKPRKAEELLRTGDLYGNEIPTDDYVKQASFGIGLGAPITRVKSESVLDEQERVKDAKAYETVAKFEEQELSRVENTFKDVESKLNDIYNKKLEISNKVYTSQEELDAAKFEWRTLEADEKEIANYGKDVLEKQLDLVIAQDDNELMLDVLKRSYNKPTVFGANLTATAAGLAAGVLNIPKWLADVTTIEGFGGGDMTLLGGGFLPFVDKHITGPWAGAFKDLEDSLREQVRKPISIEDVDSVSDLGAWSMDIVANQLPVYATLYAFPNAGLKILGASAAGTKYNEMINEENVDYNNLELFMAPAMYLASEQIMEKFTSNQIKQFKFLFEKDKSVLDAARNYVSKSMPYKTAGKDFLLESGSESGTQVWQNLTDSIILDKDINPFEGVPDAFFSGGFMSMAMHKAPALALKLLSPFGDETVKAKIRGNLAMMDLVAKEEADLQFKLKDSNTPEQDKAKIKELDKIFTKLVLDNNKKLSKVVNTLDDLNYDGYGKQRKNSLILLDVQKQKKFAELNRVLYDKNINAQTRDLIVGNITTEISTLEEKSKAIKSQALAEAEKQQNDPYADLSTSQVKELIFQNVEKTKQAVQQLGLQDDVRVNTLSSSVEITDYMKNNGYSEEEIAGYSAKKPTAFFNARNGDIIINIDQALKERKVNSAQHELLHAILRVSFKGDTKLAEKSGRELLAYVKGFVGSETGLIDTEFGRRINSYIDMVDNPNTSYYNKPHGALEEVFPLLSEALESGRISYDPNLLNKIGDHVRITMQRYGYKDISFENPSDILKFVIDYNKNFSEGKFGKTFSKFAKQGIDGKTVVSPNNAKDVLRYDQSLDALNKKVDDLVGERNEDGSYKMTKKEWLSGGINKAYMAIILGDQLDALIAKGYNGPIYGRSMEEFIDDVKNGDGGLTEVIMRFNPEKNNSLIGWINRQLQFRKEDVVRKYRENPVGVNITPEMSETLIVGDEDTGIRTEEIKKEQERQDKLIDPNRTIKGAKEEFDSKIDNVNLVELNFKTVPNLISKALSEQVGIPENKITTSSNLSDGEFAKAQDYIYKNADLLMKLLPEAKIPESASIELIGKSTGIPPTILNSLYEKVDGQWQKRSDLTKKEFLEAFALNEDGTKIDEKIKGGRSKEAQRSKSMLDMFGKLASNVLVRKYMAEQGLSVTDIENVGAGKSSLMFDAAKLVVNKFTGEDISKKGIENTTIVKTFNNHEDVLNDIYINQKLNDKEAISKIADLGLTKDQATDLHNALKRYLQTVNKNRYKKQSLIEDFVNSDNYYQFNKEQAIKDQLGITGTDLIAESEKLRAEVIKNFITPYLKRNIGGGGLKIVTVGNDKTSVKTAVREPAPTGNFIDDIEFIFHNFVRSNKTKQIDVHGNISANEYQTGTPSLFETVEDFAKHVRIVTGLNIKPRADGAIEIHDLPKRYRSEKKGPKVIWHSKNHFQKQLDSRRGIASFHNGKNGFSKQSLISSYHHETGIARDKLKNFFNALDIIREGIKDNMVGEQETVFNEKQIAMLVLNMISGNSNYINSIHRITNIIKNEDAPVKITDKDSRLYYTLKTTRDPLDFAKMLALWMKDKEFTIDDITEYMENFKASYVPSDLKIAKKGESKVSDKDLEGIKERTGKKDTDPTKVKKITVEPEKQGGLTDEEARQKELGDKLSNIISSKSKGLIKSGAVLDLDEAKRLEKETSKRQKRKIASMNPKVADFESILFSFYRKGKQGVEDKEFFYENLIRPYDEANIELDIQRINSADKFKNFEKQYKDTWNKRFEASEFSADYSNDEIIRIYLYDKAGHEIPGKTNQNVIDAIVKFVKSEKGKDLKKLADKLTEIYPGRDVWVKPKENWDKSNISLEFAQGVNDGLRDEIFQNFNKNVEGIFNENNKNKIRAAYGKDFYKALFDKKHGLLTRMSKDIYSPIADKDMREFSKFLRGSINNVMFLNTRSAFIQLLSSLNYLDFDYNNPIEAGKTAADPFQYFKDVAIILKSAYMRQRMGYSQLDIDANELAKIGEKKGILGFYRKMLDKGYILTKFGDATAIAFGGASYLGTARRKYIEELNNLPDKLDLDQDIVKNKTILDKLYVLTSDGQSIDIEENGITRTIKGQEAIDYKGKGVIKARNKYKPYYLKLKDNTLNEVAEELAFLKFYQKTEESQQSARPDRLSFQQVSDWGRLILAFQNTPMQYNRIIIKAWDDISKGRGEYGKNLSKIVYYSTLQNAIFTALTDGILFRMFMDDDDEESKWLDELNVDKIGTLTASMGSTLLRGRGTRSGLIAAVIQAATNVITGIDQKSPNWVSKAEQALTTASTPLGIKFRQVHYFLNGLQQSSRSDWRVETEMWDEMWDAKSYSEAQHIGLQNPGLDIAANALSIVNVPLSRGLQKWQNLSFMMQEQNDFITQAALLLGWRSYNLGLKESKLEEVKKRIKGRKKFMKDTSEVY